MVEVVMGGVTWKVTMQWQVHALLEVALLRAVPGFHNTPGWERADGQFLVATGALDDLLGAVANERPTGAPARGTTTGWSQIVLTSGKWAIQTQWQGHDQLHLELV